ncbi:MAG TPA: hypothetical protein PLD25_18345 [Chloroflexota bacterium]|nr:hypothetical protein [Chloroflexota bacterium]HUM68344.1 hypothetical protein [Chloroflexota bacterium]
MKVAMIRIGIDTGSGGIHGPLFDDGTFEYLPIPDGLHRDERTYGNMTGRYGRALVEFFPKRRQVKMANQSVHVDPEFTTFTYGDPTSPKARLRHLEPGDMLIFYCGLVGWEDFYTPPALYLMGYFEVLAAGKATDFSSSEVQCLFAENYHVRHRDVYESQKKILVLVKGSPESRLLVKAKRLSVVGQDRSGRPLKVLSPEMQQIFGDFGGKISFQRSPTRWVNPVHTLQAAEYMRSL